MSAVQVVEGDVVTFPNGITAVYNNWAEMILLTPPEPYRIMAIVSSSNKASVDLR